MLTDGGGLGGGPGEGRVRRVSGCGALERWGFRGLEFGLPDVRFKGAAFRGVNGGVWGLGFGVWGLGLGSRFSGSGFGSCIGVHSFVSLLSGDFDSAVWISRAGKSLRFRGPSRAVLT